MDPLLITEQAHDAVARAVGDGQKRGVELGGSLLAVEAGGVTLVAYALPTGPGADQGWGHIETDAAFQNGAITAARASFPQLVYVGDWHVHPMWLPELSATDRATARTILRDDAQGRDHLILLLGTAAPGKSPVVLGFRTALSARGVSVESRPLRRVADDSAEVKEHLGRALAPLAGLLRGETEITVAEHAEVGLVEADLDQIRSELDAEATLWLADDTLGALIRRGAREAVVLFPPEYPLGAPQVFSGSFEQGPLRPIPLRYGWSSLHRVVDVVSEALDPGGRAPRVGRRGPLHLLRVALAWAGVMPSPRLLARYQTRRQP
jgi:hypothetical protein